MSTLTEISQAIQTGKMKLIKELVPKAIEEGCSAQSILNEGLLHGMNIVGDRFTRNEAFVPEVLVAARAMNKGIELIKPLLAEEGNQPIGECMVYGKSITDPCLGWKDTERLILEIAERA